MKEFLQKCAPFRSRILGLAIGILIAILFLTAGFWRTLLLVLLGGAGYLIGLWKDDKAGFAALLGRLRHIKDILKRE